MHEYEHEQFYFTGGLPSINFSYWWIESLRKLLWYKKIYRLYKGSLFSACAALHHCEQQLIYCYYPGRLFSISYNTKYLRNLKTNNRKWIPIMLSKSGEFFCVIICKTIASHQRHWKYLWEINKINNVLLLVRKLVT